MSEAMSSRPDEGSGTNPATSTISVTGASAGLTHGTKVQLVVE